MAATRRTRFEGERYGDWYVESKATPLEGKRRWHCVNTVTDERRLILQTELKNLADEEEVMPSSREITTKVLIGNYKDDPFNIPDGILPEDDDEYPFEPVFTEPEFVPVLGEVVDINADNPFDVQMSADFDDDGELSATTPEPVSLSENIRGFIETLTANMADGLVGVIREWQVIAVNDLLRDIKVNGEPIQ